MPGLNKVMLIGSLGRDPEMRQTAKGTVVTNFSMATTERFKSKEGEWKDSTEWHKVVAWGALGKTYGERLHKGSTIYLEGKITTRSYEAKDGGGKRSTTEIVAHSIQILSGGKQANGKGGKADDDEGGYVPPDDDDIPF